MIQKFHNKPKNWQDFEVLCAHLWKKEYGCYDINRNGRQGQKQNGVDIYGYIHNGTELFGIQCKGKDLYNHSQLTIREIDKEITKALSFIPRLSFFIIATTSSRDADIQEYIRIKDQEYFHSHGMHICVYFWDSIEELLEYHTEVKNWYEGTFIKSYDIEIDPIVPEGKLMPKFDRVTRDYTLPSKNSGSAFYLLNLINLPIVDIFHTRPYKNHTWCEFDILIKNIGKSVLEDYQIELSFDEAEVRAISNMCDKYTNNLWEYELNKEKKQNLELYHYSNDQYSLLFKPKERVLVQKDHRIFRIGIFPKYTATTIHITWNLIARDYDCEGTLAIPVAPSFKDVHETKFVLNYHEIRTENVIEECIEYLDEDELEDILE